MKAICRLFLTTFLGLWMGTAFGQSPAAAGKVRFRLMSWDSEITDLNYAQDKKIIPVKLLANGRSSFYDYRGSDPLLFFREITGPDGKPAAEVAASVALTDFKERTLLMFFRSRSNPKQYQVQVVDDSDAAIPPGSYHFFNLTDVPVRVACGSASAEVPPQQEATVQGVPAAGAQTMGMRVDAVTPTGVMHAYSNMLPFGKTARTLVFVSRVPGTGAFDVKRLAEDVAALPKPSPSSR